MPKKKRARERMLLERIETETKKMGEKTREKMFDQKN